MPSIALEVEKTIRSRPYVLEAMSTGIASFAGLASSLKPEIERKTGQKVNKAAIVMALRRMKITPPIPSDVFSSYSDSIIRTGLVRIVAKSFKTNVGKVVEFFRSKKPETFNIIYTDEKSVIFCRQAYEKVVLRLLKKDRMQKIDHDIASITVNFNSKLADIGQFLYLINSGLHSRGISLIDHVFGLDRLTLFLSGEDVSEAHTLIEETLRGER